MPLRIRTVGVAAALALVASLVTAVALPAPSSAAPPPATPPPPAVPSRAGQPSPAAATVGIGGQPDGALAVQLSVPGRGGGRGLVRPVVVSSPALPPTRTSDEPSSGDQGVLVDLGVNGVHGLDLRGGGNGGGIVTLQVAIADRPIVGLGQPAPESGVRPAPLNLPGLSLDLGGLLRG
ncbi:MAG: hypothetical protein ACRD0Q_11615 [Acidimicrobiales bacterium]